MVMAKIPTRDLLPFGLLLALAGSAAWWYPQDGPVAEGIMPPGDTLPGPVDSELFHDSRRSVGETGSLERRAPGSEELPVERATEPVALMSGVHGTVLDSLDRPVEGVGVLLYHGRERHKQVTDGRGAFEFKNLAGGQHRLFVDRSEMPRGLLAPWKQGVPRIYTGEATGIHGTSFMLPDHEDLQVDLRVFRVSEVTGSVIGSSGEPIEGALATIRSQNGVLISTRTDQWGLFRLEGVYPGLYVIQVETPPDQPELAGHSPLPTTFEIGSGELVRLEDMVLGGVGCVLQGRIVDEDGLGVEGLDLLVHGADSVGIDLRWSARTDLEGSFRLGRLSPGDLRLEVVDPTRALAEIPPPRALHLGGSQESWDLGVWEVERDRSFRVLGRVRVDPHWADVEGLDHYTLALEQLPPVETTDDATERWIDKDLG